MEIKMPLLINLHVFIDFPISTNSNLVSTHKCGRPWPYRTGLFENYGIWSMLRPTWQPRQPCDHKLVRNWTAEIFFSHNIGFLKTFTITTIFSRFGLNFLSVISRYDWGVTSAYNRCLHKLQWQWHKWHRKASFTLWPCFCYNTVTGGRAYRYFIKLFYIFLLQL